MKTDNVLVEGWVDDGGAVLRVGEMRQRWRESEAAAGRIFKRQPLHGWADRNGYRYVLLSPKTGEAVSRTVD